MTFQRLGRILLAGPAAALVVAAVFTFLTGSIPIALIAFFYALFFGASVGLPLFMIAQFRFPISLVSTVTIGFVTGMVPFGVILEPWTWDKYTNMAHDYVPTVVKGIPTLAGWLYFAKGFVLFGILGAVA